MHVLMFQVVKYPVKMPLRGVQGANNTVGTKKVKEARQRRGTSLAVLIQLAHKGEIGKLDHV